MSSRLRFSPLAERLSRSLIDEGGWEAWRTHYAALSAAARGEDVIILSVGDTDFDTPHPARAAVAAALERGETHYTPLLGTPELRDAIAADHQQRKGIPCAPETVVVTCGAQGALFTAMLLLAGPGDEILVPEPCYVTYGGVIAAAGATAVRVPTRPEAGWRIERPALEAALSPRTKGLLVASPNNPTGTILSGAERALIAQVAAERGLFVLLDEVYSRTVFDGSAHSLQADTALDGLAIVIDSFSKSHAMTGWRVGWMIGPEALADRAEDLHLAMNYGLPGFVQAGALAALTEAEAASDRMRRSLKRRRDVFVSALNAVPGLEVAPPEGGMFAFIDVRGTGLSGGAFTEQLFAAEGVSLVPGATFAAGADGFARAAFALPEEQLLAAAGRISRFVRRL